MPFDEQSELFIRGRCKQGNHQIFQRDDADTQRHEFGIGQIRNCNSPGVERRTRGGPSGPAPPSLSHLDRAR